jgi:PAS domain S-box-containing protein
LSRGGRIAWLLPAALLAYLGTLSLMHRAATLRADDGVIWLARGEHLEAARVEALGPGGLAGIRLGDLLLQVGKEAPRPGSDVGRLLSGREGRPTRYRLLREDRPLEVKVLPRPADGQNRVFYYLFIAGLAALGAGSLAFWKLSFEPAAPALYGFSLCLAALLVLSPVGGAGILSWIFYWGDLVGRLFLPVFLLAFVRRLMCDDEDLFTATPRGRWLALPALLLLAVAICLIPFQGALAFSDPVRAIRLKDRLELAYLALASGYSVVLLWLGLWRSTRSRTRWRLTSAAAAAAAGLLPPALLYLLPLSMGITPGPLGEIAVLPLGLVPLGFAATLFQERSVDLDRSLRAVVRSSAAGAVFLAGGLFGSYLLTALPGGIGGGGVLTEIVLPLAFSSVLAVLLHRPLIGKVDRLLGSRSPDAMQLMLRFREDLGAELRLERLAQRLRAGLQEAFGLAPVHLLVDADGTGSYEETPMLPGLPGERLEFEIPQVARQSLALREVVLLQTGGDSLPEEIRAGMCRRGCRYLFPLITAGVPVAFLVVGAHRDGSPLSGSEIDALAALSTQVAKSVEAARLYREIEVRGRREAALRRETEAILESSRIGILLADASGRITAANRASAEVLGVATPVGRTVASLLPRGLLMLLDRCAREDRTGAGERVYRFSFGAQDGSTRVLNATRSPLGGAPGAGTVYTLDDVSEQVRREERMLQQDHLASMGLLASQVAHEVNAPLTGIASYAQILMARLKSRLPEMELLRKIEAQAFRAAGITGSVLNFVRRKDREAAGEFDPGPVVAESLALFEPQLKGKRIRVSVERAPSLPAVRGHRGRLQQVLINLLLNAAQALPGGGEIRIAIDREGEALRVRVSDNGIGIPAAQLPRIFEPFFSGRSGGTGLGLAVVREIVSEHGGEIAVESVEGAGSTFTVKIPAAPARATAAEVVAPVAS